MLCKWLPSRFTLSPFGMLPRRGNMLIPTQRTCSRSTSINEQGLVPLHTASTYSFDFLVGPYTSSRRAHSANYFAPLGGSKLRMPTFVFQGELPGTISGKIRSPIVLFGASRGNVSLPVATYRYSYIASCFPVWGSLIGLA